MLRTKCDIRRFLYGPNLIHVPVKSVLELLLLQVLNPFYIFQVSAIIIWCMVENYYFAAAVFLMSATGVIISIIQTRKVSILNYCDMYINPQNKFVSFPFKRISKIYKILFTAVTSSMCVEATGHLKLLEQKI